MQAERGRYAAHLLQDDARGPAALQCLGDLHRDVRAEDAIGGIEGRPPATRPVTTRTSAPRMGESSARPGAATDRPTARGASREDGRIMPGVDLGHSGGDSCHYAIPRPSGAGPALASGGQLEQPQLPKGPGKVHGALA